VIRKKLKEDSKAKIPALCISIEDPFSEMEQFIQETSERYCIVGIETKASVFSYWC